MTSFETKDSGERIEYKSGMRRDIQSGKPRFDLLLVDGQPYEEQFLTRIAALLERGAEKYGERNWQLASSEEELARFKSSGLRHMHQWLCGEQDEDHAAAVVFNIMAAEYVRWKLDNGIGRVITAADMNQGVSDPIVEEEGYTPSEDCRSGDPHKCSGCVRVPQNGGFPFGGHI